MKKVAVIILNWNGAALLRRYLTTVVENTNPDIAEVVVADNGSTDESLKVLSEEFPTVKVIKLDQNYGFAEGYNQALKVTQNEYTVLLNSDVRTPAGWLDPMLEYMESHPEVGAMQPKLLHDGVEGKDTFDYAGAAGGYIDCHGYPYCRGRIFDAVEDDNGQYDDIIPSIVWASGACLLVRTALYKQVGGLDKDFFAHMEEIDLCWRIILSGHEVKMLPRSAVYHLGGASLAYGNPQKTYLNFRNNLVLLHKNLPEKDAKRTLLVRRLLDTLAWGKAVATLHWADAKAILKAHNDFRAMRRNYTQHPTRNLLKEMPECRCNIITDYYLKGRKIF